MNGIDEKSIVEFHAIAVEEEMAQRSSKEESAMRILVELNVLMTGRRCKRFTWKSEAFFSADMLFS